MTSRILSRDYRLKANSPSGTIADQDTFTYDSSSRMLTGVSGRYGNTRLKRGQGRMALSSLNGRVDWSWAEVANFVKSRQPG